MWANKGTWLGIGLTLLSILVKPLVAIYATTTDSYPWWMVTPDDPVSPFGQSEETVRNVYARFGRYVGDVYWLAVRNCLYGLTYALKPSEFKDTSDYSDFHMLRDGDGKGRKTVYSIAGYKQWVYNFGPVTVLGGWKVKGVWNDPKTPRQHINMEFTPVFSIRRRKDA